MNPEIASSILKRYLNGTCSEEEKLLVEAWFSRVVESGEPLQLPAQEIGDRLYSRILQEIAAAGVQKKEPGKTGRRTLVLRWLSGVAAMLLLIAGAALLWENAGVTPSKEQGLPMVKAPDIRPAGGTAYLTLPGGESVALEGQADTVRSREGRLLARLKDSILVYNTGNAGCTAACNTLHVPPGGFFRMQLPDGSKVWLNAASELKFPDHFEGGQRIVELKGEGYFEVVHNSRQPFVVKTGALDVTVLGTSFNIQAYHPEQVKTTLISGSVRVDRDAKQRFIKPGQRYWYDQQSNREVIDQPDLSEVLAWKEGRYRFSNERIQHIMECISRWYNVAITYRGPVPEYGFSGSISRKKNANVILNALEQTEEVHFLLEGNRIVVIKGKK
ncbi:FecR family protein [Niabella drilacis]|nr:FecR family protein [Niabella drilacis]